MKNNLLNPILINSIVNLLSILFGILLTYYFTKRRYSYEKLFDKKLVSLEEIYSKVISLEKDIKRYNYGVGANPALDSLPQKREEISLIQGKFFELRDYFWEKEILLGENSVSVVQSFIDFSLKVIAEFITSVLSQELKDGRTSYEQWKKGFLLVENELPKIKKQLKEDFKETIKSNR